MLRLRTRIALAAGAAVLVAIALFAAGSYLLISERAYDRLDASLEETADRVAAELSAPGAGARDSTRAAPGAPADGLPDEETEHLAGVIRAIPERIGALVILVDHDMSLVQNTCSITAVLDFGRLIAAGPTAEVLRNEHVIKAYLGTEEEL